MTFALRFRDLAKGRHLALSYLTAATFALILLIAFPYAASGWLALAFPQIAADTLLFLGAAALAAGVLAVIGVCARSGVVLYNASITTGKLAERELRTSEDKFAKFAVISASESAVPMISAFG